LAGRGDKNLEQAVAMEVSLNLCGLGIINDLKAGANLALETINGGVGIKVLEDLVVYSGGDIQKFNSLVNI
jgi:anthranilate phosphoribosyltransferase